MIEYISISKIEQHPDNPRKDLGDLEELAESIKTSGILQNLTVVPWFSEITRAPADNDAMKDYYRAVIGHRRLAAAKLAGLTEVPCVIAEMDYKTQVATMLLENMQRSDLTVYEQAQGMQMMISLGETVADIASKTGFSEATVRKRTKLLELDSEKFQHAQERGATLMDFARLNEVEDVKERDKLLDSIGTNNFDWAINKALKDQAAKKNRPLVKKELESFATKISEKNTNKYEWISYIHFSNWKEGEKIPKDAGKKKYFYTLNGDLATLYRERAKTEKKKANPAEKSFREKEAKLKELTAQAYALRSEFVKNFNSGKKHQKEIMAFAMGKLLTYGRAELHDLLKLLNVEEPVRDEQSVRGYQEQEDAQRSLVMEKYAEQPERVLLMASYLGMGDGKIKGYCEFQSWSNKVNHRKSTDLDLIYDTLASLGYKMSDEEQALRDGAHELFKED